MKRTLLAILLNFILLSTVLAEEQQETRTWRSAKGSEVKAVLVRRAGSSVVLKGEDGEQFMIRVNDLSRPDREYLDQLKEAELKLLKENKASFLSKKKPAQRAQADKTEADYLSKVEREVIDEMNLARTEPAEYAKFLKKYMSLHVGDNVFEIAGRRIRTKEGVAAVKEAIEFLEKDAKAVKALKPSRGLSLAAKDHVDDIGPAGMAGHVGTKGSTMTGRIEKRGQWEKTIGENISFGKADARGIVMQLIIDDGVPGRGHRKNIFKGDFKVAGVSIGPHKVYGKMCCIDYAGGFSD